MLLNFVNALNAIHGQLLLFVLIIFAMVLLYLRYYKVQPTGSIVDSLNAVHVAWLGFALCLCGIFLIVAGHDQAGDKVFLSGASFIGGIAATRAVNGNGNGNGATVASNLQSPTH